MAPLITRRVSSAGVIFVVPTLYFWIGAEAVGEIVKVKNDSYGRYEELLLRRDRLRKECYLIQAEYIGVFGQLMIDLLREQLTCAKKKKTIEFCQAAANHGRKVDDKSLCQFVSGETKKLSENLDKLISDYDAVQLGTRITEAERLQIKSLYHKLVKMIHPDINPLTAVTPELMTLWNNTVAAYNGNDLDRLQELEVLINRAWNDLYSGEIEVEIPDIETKIEELEQLIKEIMETDPYQYQFLLLDEEAVKRKEEELSDTLKQYKEYGLQLDEILRDLLPEGSSVVWDLI